MDQFCYYTDGSLLPRSKCGGFAAVPVTSFGRPIGDKIVTGARRSGSSLEMELLAIISALRATPAGADVTIFSDFKAVCDVLAQPHRAGCESGRYSGIWNQARQLYNCRNVTLRWIRGHAGNPCNELADRLARDAARMLEKQCELA